MKSQEVDMESQNLLGPPGHVHLKGNWKVSDLAPEALVSASLEFL